MAFPEDILNIKVEAGNLVPGFTWENITEYVYKESIKITRGSADESSRTQPSSVTFLLNNIDGRFSPRNPNGPYYGFLKKNTPLLISVEEGDRYLDVPGSGRARVLDTAQIDITGDIDVRVDATLYNWTADGETIELMAKYDVASDERSWAFNAFDGKLFYRWSADGINTTTVLSTATFSPAPDGRLAVRATHDVNDGSGNNVITFYTAPTVEGPWTQLGDPVTSSGTTSIFNGAAQLAVGDAMEDVGFTAPRGKFWAAQVYNGINGTVAADVDFTVQTDGDTSFVDDAGLTWGIEGSAHINNQQNRFRGEVVAWPSRWETGGFDAWVTVRAESLLRRHNQGQGNLRSAMARAIPNSDNLMAYWPMEDGEAATSFGALSPNTQPLTFTGDVTPAGHPGPDGSDSLPSFSAGSYWRGTVPSAGAGSSAAQVEWVVNIQQLTATQRTIMYVSGTGTIITWRFLIDNSGSPGATIIGYNRAGTAVVNQGVGLDINGEMLNKWTRWQFKIEQDGANVDWTATWIPIGGAGGTFSGTYAGTCGRFSAVSGPPDGLSSDIDGLSWGHIAVYDAVSSAYNDADHGYTGESALDRFERLLEEEGESGIFYGSRGETFDMGAQRPDRFIDLLEETAGTDYGIFSDGRDWADENAFVFIGRAALYNDTPRLVLDYEGDGQVHAPLDPTDDDLYTRNAVTASRERGSSVYAERATADEGPNSIEEVGKYDTEIEVNTEDDDRLIDFAGWELHLGTWDEERYPTVLVRLQAAPDLIGDAMQVNVGSRIMIRNARDESTRTWIPPGDIELQVRGYRETLSQYEWEIEFQCVPARPWDVAVLEHLGISTNRIDTDGSEIVEALDTTETAIDVITTAMQPNHTPITWTDEVENMPFDVTVGGEVMRVVAPGSLINANPFFDTDATNWSGQAASVARSTTFVHPDPSAVASLLVTPNGSLSNAVALAAQTSSGTITVGGQYVISGWFYSPGGYDQARMIANWHQSDGTYISTSSGTITALPAGEWTYIEDTVTAPALASKAAVGALETNSPTASEVFYVWGVRITRIKASWAYDRFGRTDTDTWTTADSSQTWTNTGGVAADYDVLSGYGRHINQATSTGHHSVMTAPDPDFDIICDITTAAASTGASQFAGVLARYVDANNLYEARLEFSTANVITLAIRERAAGVEATLGAAFTHWRAHAALTYMRVRFQGTGTTLKAKAWRVGDPEPDVWQVETTDGTLTSAGSIGVKSVRNAGNTNANAEFRFDNFEVLNPQTLGVERSRNGIVKPHSSGAGVALTYPMHLAL